MWQHQWAETSATPPVDDTGGFLRFSQIAKRSRAVAVDGFSN